MWRLREFAACGPIAKQIRQAISEYLQKRTGEIGCSISDLAEAIERHERENKKEG